MKQKKCTICTKVKGKRGCLLKDMTLICSRCCAETRNPECVGCTYYKESQKFELEKAKKSPKHFTMRIDPEIDDEIDRALAMAQSGNLAAAETSINSLREGNEDLYTIHFAVGTIYGMKEDYDKAIEHYDKSLAIYPYFVDCWFNRAIAAQKKMDMEKVLISLRQVVEIGEPNDSPVIDAKKMLEGLSRNIFEDSGLGLDDYLDSLKFFNKAFKLMENKEWQQALVGFKKSSVINPRAQQAFGNMGICYMNLADNKTALEMLDEAIELDSSYEPAIMNRKFLIKRMEEGDSSDIPMQSVSYMGNK